MRGGGGGGVTLRVFVIVFLRVFRIRVLAEVGKYSNSLQP